MKDMQNGFKRNLVAASLASLMMLGMAGCSDDDKSELTSESGAGVSQPSSAQPSAADVKQPEPVVVPEVEKAVEATTEKAEEVVEEVEQAVTQEVEEVVETVEEAAAAPAKSGSNLYATCIGCHGASGDGGVGPKLAGQSKEDIASKLAKYKAGEQLGAMTAMMAPMATGLSDEDIQTVSEYIAGF